MYARIAACIGLAVLIYGLIEGPDHFYNKGYKKGYSTGTADVEASVANAVATAKNDLRLEHAKQELANEIKFREINHDYNTNLEKVKSEYNRKLASGLLFNKDGICSSKTGTSSEGESIQGSNEGTSSNGLLPETYSRNIIEVMTEADKLSETVRSLQAAINKSSCFVKE